MATEESEHMYVVLSLIYQPWPPHTESQLSNCSLDWGINGQLSCCSNTKMADKRLGGDFEGGGLVKSGFNNEWYDDSLQNNAVWWNELWIIQNWIHYYNYGGTSFLR